MVTTERPSTASDILIRKVVAAVKEPKGARVVLWTAIVFGAVLRLNQYMSDRSLWLDEAMLALNIVTKSYGELLGRLDVSLFHQAAPIGFLYTVKTASVIFGDGERALRLPALLFGLGALFLFARVARQVASRSVPLIAVVLFASSYRLIYYSSEVKPYIVDVAALLIIVTLAYDLLSGEVLSRSRTALLGFAGGLLIWFSYTAVFALAGVGSVLLVDAFVRQDRRRVAALIASILAWVGSFSVLVPFLLTESTNQYLVDYWTPYFVPFPPSSIADVRWFDQTFIRMFQNPIGMFPSSLAAFCFILGCISLTTTKPRHLCILVSPIVPALVASALHRYPFDGRLILFIVPIAFILVAEGLCRISIVSHDRAPLIGGTVAACLLVPVIAYAAGTVWRPLGDEDIKGLLDYVNLNASENDVLYVHYESIPAFTYYSSRLAIGNKEIVLGGPYKDDLQTYVNEEIGRCERYDRIWLLFSHIRAGGPSDDSLFVTRFRVGFELVKSFKSPGAAIYLFTRAK